MKTITKKTAKNGATLYYIDGRRASRADAMYWQRQNENERKYLARIEAEKTFSDAMSEVNTTAETIDAAVEAEIEIVNNAAEENADNEIVATVDKAGNVEIKKQTPTYIFTAYQIVTGVDCNGRTERVESFATTCKELGDDDNFTGLYRAVTFYEDWHYNAWDIKTADGKLIAKGNTEAELKKAYEAIKAGNVEVSEEIAEINAAEVDPAEYAISEAAMEVAINAEGHNADVASGNYSVDINGEYVRFENHSIVRIDAMRKMNWIYDHTGANKIFRYGNRKSSAAKVIDMYMNRERAKEQGKYFHEFFDQYCKTCGDIVVLVELTYADDREHHFRAEFNQGRLADKFIADVKELAGDTPCQIFKKYRDNHIKPVWEDPHKYETVGNLEHARHLYGEETVGDIAPDEYIITQEAMDEAIEAEEDEAFFAKREARILADPAIDAAYRKAKERVEVTFTKYGYPQYRYRKTSGEWTDNERVAKAYISKCGLSETRFIVKAKHDLPAPPNFSTKTDKNGKTLYYIDGKRVGHYEYIKQFDCRAELIDEMPDKQLRWLNKPEDIYEDATTLESVSGVKRDEVADVKGIGDLADRYIAIDGATVQSVEVKQVGRSNSYYIDGKRTSRDKALDACATIRGDNHFTIEYQRGRYGDDGKIVYSTERKTMSRLDLKINAHGDGYSVHFYNGFATVHIFEEYEDAKACFNQIEAAYLAGKAGVKVDSGGKVSDLDTRHTEEIGDDLIVWHGDEWHGTYSLKYDADFFKGIRSGKLHYRVGARVVSEQDFWRAMQKCGACTNGGDKSD